MYDILTFQSKSYPYKCVNMGDDIYLVAGEALEEKLLNEDRSNYTSDEARSIDERVFFYLPEGILDEDEIRIRRYVEQNAF